MTWSTGLTKTCRVCTPPAEYDVVSTAVSKSELVYHDDEDAWS